MASSDEESELSLVSRSAGAFTDALLSTSSVSHGPPLVINNNPSYFIPATLDYLELSGLDMFCQYLSELAKDHRMADVFIRSRDPRIGFENIGTYEIKRSGTKLKEVRDYQAAPRTSASKSAIAALPTFIITTADKQKSLTCSICMYDLEPGTKATGMAVCDHVFHSDCLRKWFEGSNSCPTCRKTIPGDNIPEVPKKKFEIDLLLPFASAPNLYSNLSLLSPDQIELAKMLVEIGQSHLFRHWPEPGIQDVEKKAFFDQVARLDSSYPGGLAAYVKTARGLFADSSNGKNPFDGFTPSVPTGENLSYGDETFLRFEETGIREAQNAAFVLVAGRLGEHLGYSGIKVALPCETTTGCCFLQHYVENILALQEASCKITGGQSERDIPFAIMTSDDTHELTMQLIESNSYFGMKPAQIKLLKQEKVACLEDNDARLALDPENKFRIQTKHHGHGDVHALLYSSGLLEEWQRGGVKWAIFFHETNGLLFKTIPASLGVSAAKGYHVNSLAVHRKAKEDIGAIAMLNHTDGTSMVINVEYNQLDTLIRATGNPDGDVNCQTGYSPFPGNTNQLIMELDPYLQELKKTGGAIMEFVNPKYKDATKTSFKSSTCLECMLQDYPRTLPPSARVGFTVMDAWVAYAPVTDNPEDAAKVPKGYPYHSATSGEMAVYRANSLILRKAGVQVEDPVQQEFNGQDVEWWPRVVWKPKWGLTFSDVKKKVIGSSSISQKSTLALKGRNIFIENLSLDGALMVESHDEAEVIAGGSVQNKGWTIEKVEYKDASVSEEIRMRGFRFQKAEQFELKASTSNH